MVNVNASDHKDQISSRICVNLMKEDRGFGEGCFILHLYFVCLKTNERFGSQTITVLSHSYLKCLSCGSFLARWFIWGKLKDTDCLAKLIPVVHNKSKASGQSLVCLTQGWFNI